ncbi:hypothetical protein D3C87_1877180 [compost metagenome]
MVPGEERRAHRTEPEPEDGEPLSSLRQDRRLQETMRDPGQEGSRRAVAPDAIAGNGVIAANEDRVGCPSDGRQRCCQITPQMRSDRESASAGNEDHGARQPAQAAGDVLPCQTLSGQQCRE